MHVARFPRRIRPIEALPERQNRRRAGLGSVDLIIVFR
jgi:hypothetical protein